MSPVRFGEGVHVDIELLDLGEGIIGSTIICMSCNMNSCPRDWGFSEKFPDGIDEVETIFGGVRNVIWLEDSKGFHVVTC